MSEWERVTSLRQARPTDSGAQALTGTTRAGRTATRLLLTVHFGESRRHPFSGVFQQGCQNLGRCDLGCPVLAKNTVDITY
jgi:hypothetical protein